eukprot:3514759-Prymnesium_polylepis.2
MRRLSRGSSGGRGPTPSSCDVRRVRPWASPAADAFAASRHVPVRRDRAEHSTGLVTAPLRGRGSRVWQADEQGYPDAGQPPAEGAWRDACGPLLRA